MLEFSTAGKYIYEKLNFLFFRYVVDFSLCDFKKIKEETYLIAKVQPMLVYGVVDFDR